MEFRAFVSGCREVMEFGLGFLGRVDGRIGLEGGWGV